MNERMEKIKNWSAFFLLLLGFAICAVLVVNTQSELKPPGKRTLLLAHWQGERGCKEALDEVIKDYERLHPDVEVRQQIIVGCGSSFVRWCVTQIIAGTMPDIMEYHSGFRPYLTNYFAGLSEYVNKPNPYNEGTDLENIPWKDTFYGGMKGSWESELLDYYTIPNTIYTMRFYCDNRLFKEATESGRTPETMSDYFNTCERLKRRSVIPVVAENASGDAGLQLFSYLYQQMFWTLEDSIDYNHDGMVNCFEYYRGRLAGDFKFDTGRMKALMELVGKASSYWGKGANATNFETAPYLFIQGKGASYFCGSWLGRQMVQSCKFELGDFPFPLIGKDDPIAGKYYCGPWGENTMQPGMSLTVADSPNKELAVDFLQFLTTRENNAKFNAGPCWLPGVIGADVPNEMKGFKPLIRGRAMGPEFMSSGLSLESRRILQNFIAGTCGYDAFIKELDSLYMEYAPKDYARDTSRTFARLAKLEELRDGLDSIRDEVISKGKPVPPNVEAKLQELYECQLTGLNEIWGVRGTSRTGGGNAQ